MKNEFKEVETYIENIKSKFLIQIIEFTDMKNCIEVLKQEYNIDIIVLGVRRTDPNCSNASVYQATDEDWPYIMRYNPLLDWTYSDVWDYIELYSLSVCSLYEKGYTSLGTFDNTFPNYYLFDGIKFKHAKNLIEEKYEREGRIKVSLPFSFSGRVIHGKGIGKNLGFPTANLDIDLIFRESKCLDEGIYYGTCILASKIEKMVLSVGFNPVFQDKSVEVHILQTYVEDFYDHILNVSIKGFIRKSNNYDSMKDLISAINKDIEFSNFLMSC